MVDAPVQKGPVVGDQEKAPLPGQVVPHQGPSGGVQVVGGLVNEEEAVVPEEEEGQEEPGPLPVGEGGKGPVQHPLLQAQQPQLLHQPPLLQLRAQGLRHRPSLRLRVGHLKGKVVKGLRGGDGAGIPPLPQEQPQQGGLAPAVAADEPQPPVGVQLEGEVLKDRLKAALIGEAQVGDLDQSHEKRLQYAKMGAERQRSAPILSRWMGRRTT